MTVFDLDFAPRTRGRAAKALSMESVRELTEADLAMLASEKGVVAPAVVRIRDRHHALARVLAQGMTPAEASLVTGYDVSRISILRADPTFKGLVEQYAKIEGGLQADFIERATTLSLTAVNNLQEMLEDDQSPLPAQTQLEIAKFAADRIGHAPIARSVNVNANIGVGDRLAAARARLALAQAETVTEVPLDDE